MIRRFWVQNYLSIRDRQELNFIAKGPESEFVAMCPDGTFAYKLCILFGANASGKSNMLYALNEIFKLLVLPQSNADDKPTGYQPFALSKNEPTQMFVSFYAESVRFDYEVKFDKKRIQEEKLYYYPNKSKSLFYSRAYVGENVQADIKFGTSLRIQAKTQESIRENTLNNHSVLSVCLKNTFKEDIKPLSGLHGWLMEHYHEVDGDYSDKGLVEILKEAHKDKRKYRFYNLMLKKADLNILDFHPTKEDHKISPQVREQIQKANIPEKVKGELLNPVTESVAFVNTAGGKTFDIPLKLQSKGTLKYIRILKTLYDLISGKHVYYLDELGEDLHHELLAYYINVFLFNSEQSQLLITSQDTTLLSQDSINENRGVVWFAEKDNATASSRYSRGDSFGLHKNLSLYNSYRIGRLGAKPELGSIFLNLNDD